MTMYFRAVNKYILDQLTVNALQIFEENGILLGFFFLIDVLFFVFILKLIPQTLV